MDLKQLLPPPANHLTQKCVIGVNLLTALGAKLGQYATIATAKGMLICDLWPRDDAIEGFIQPYDFVCKMDSDTTKINQIELLEQPKKLKWIRMTVVLEDYACVAQVKSQCQVTDRIVGYVRSILHSAVVKDKFHIKCHELCLGKLYGISHIIVNSVPAVSCGCIRPSTKIIIENVLSRDRYEQNHKKLNRCLGGFDRLTLMLSELVKMPFEKRHLLEKSGARCINGILVYGPPGSGKTSLVQHVADVCDAYLLTVHMADIMGSRAGETEVKLRQLFHKADEIGKEGPCILFIDEVDALAPQNTKGSSTMDRRVINQLAALLDTMQGHHVVIAATNQVAAVDKLLRRPGRLEKEIILGIPTLEQRCEILHSLTSNLQLAPDVDLDYLSEATPGFVPADLASLVQQAWFAANVKNTTTELHQKDFVKALHITTPSTQRGSDIVVNYKPVQWSDIGGLNTVKNQLIQAIEWPLKHQQAFKRLGIAQPKGVLLYGPPGCAKTMLVRAAATSCHVTFLAISGAQLYSPYVGDSERRITEVFRQARAGAPTILFIDEIDCVVGRRQSQRQGVQERVLSTLLNEMDGVGLKTEHLTRSTDRMAAGQEGHTMPSMPGNTVDVDNCDVLVVAATNRPDMLDDALIRPGRMDRLVYVPPPDLQSREEILKVYTREMPLQDVDLHQIAIQTEQFTGADLENLCREAALHALSLENLEVSCVKGTHFEDVLKTVQPSLTTEELEQYANLSKTNHES